MLLLSPKSYCFPGAPLKKRAESVLSQLGIPMSTAIDMYLNQISLVGGIPFAVTLPKAPESVNEDLKSAEELCRKLQKGLDDVENGKVKLASKAFDEFRENH